MKPNNPRLPLVLLVCLFSIQPNVIIANGDPGLIEAVKAGDSDVIRALIGSADVNASKADGTTALHYAVHRNDIDLVKRLIQAGAEPGPANAYGVTPLSLACTNRNPAMVKILLDAGADPDAARWTGRSVLMDCIRTGVTEAVSILLEAGADANAREEKMGQTALMWAAAGGYAKITRMLIDHGADITARTLPSEDRVPNTCRICEWKPSPGGFTALMFAARSGDIDTVRYLVEAGADPNDATPEHGNALVIASASNHEDLALYLLEAGADPESRDENGVTALHHAHKNGLSRMHGITYDPVYRVRPGNMPRLARALLEAGTDPNVRIEKSYKIGPAIRSACESADDMVGATPFMLAAISADAHLIRMLGDYEADPAIPTSDGTTPLMAAARSSCTGENQEDNTSAAKRERALQAVKAIVEMGVDIDAVNDKGETAMHKAAFTGAASVVKFLAESGAKIDVKNRLGETPWSMASGISPVLNNRGAYGNHEGTAALLLSLGANPITREDMIVPDAYSNFGEREVSIDYSDVTEDPEKQ